ncbi:RHS repeat-associated core domain-containing protein [Chryseobacterium gleum]|uniref:RHS repeat-associated core domain-containing protein n=1 Tax=Chryseobacterium gleum TaxID=250 RepID=UPI00293EC5BF|nr:RHS repeat-associated core domain-containing protein [Chryseobacterium gleum]
MSGAFSTSGFGSFYSYKYNGKELQETGMYDYGARMLMPDLGRWGSMDAMSEKYSAWSPYNYAINNPVMVIDPDGNDISYSGEAAQQAFKAYVATMSTSTESSGDNIFTGSNSFLDEYEIDLKTGKKKKLSNLGGNEIDFYHYINGGSQFNERTRIVDRETGIDQWMSSSKNIKGYNHRGDNVDWDLMYDEFLQGSGPEKSLLIGKNNKAVQKLIKTQIYLDAATDFAETSMNEKTSYEASFGLWGLLRENFNIQGQFMGKTNFSFYPLGNKVVIMAFDSKSVSSYSLNPFNKGRKKYTKE